MRRTIMPPSRMSTQPDLAAVPFHANDARSCLKHSSQCSLQGHIHLRISQQLPEVRIVSMQCHCLEQLVRVDFRNNTTMFAKATTHHMRFRRTHQL